jgi:hypothetical protein
MTERKLIPLQKLLQNRSPEIEQLEKTIAVLQQTAHPCPDAEKYLHKLKEAARHSKR